MNVVKKEVLVSSICNEHFNQELLSQIVKFYPGWRLVNLEERESNTIPNDITNILILDFSLGFQNVERILSDCSKQKPFDLCIIPIRDEQVSIKKTTFYKVLVYLKLECPFFLVQMDNFKDDFLSIIPKFQRDVA